MKIYERERENKLCSRTDIFIYPMHESMDMGINRINILTGFLFLEESTIPGTHASFGGSAFVSKGCFAATAISSSNKTMSDTQRKK